MEMMQCLQCTPQTRGRRLSWEGQGWQDHAAAPGEHLIPTLS